MAGHRSLAVPLSWAYAALIVYASLYPFSGWRLPGPPLLAFLQQPWWPWWSGFDVVANLVGYVPLGLLAFIAAVRSGRRAAFAWAVVIAGGALLSLTLETLQNFLPQRVPSRLDLLLNAGGSALGAALGHLMHSRGWLTNWQMAHDRWFTERSAGGMALLLLWPVGLLFPTPVPLGVGQIVATAEEALLALVDGTPVAGRLQGWIAPVSAAGGMSPLVEGAVMALGLLGPCLVAFSISSPGWRRLVLVAGAVALGCAATTLSTALNFGPEHALAWNTPRTLAALAAGSVAALLSSPLPRRAAAGLGLVALTALVVLIANAPSDPYFAESLQSWEQGRFIRFHGAAQWVGWLWPYAAVVYLLGRVTGRDEAAAPAAPKMPR